MKFAITPTIPGQNDGRVWEFQELNFHLMIDKMHGYLQRSQAILTQPSMVYRIVYSKTAFIVENLEFLCEQQRQLLSYWIVATT